MNLGSSRDTSKEPESLHHSLVGQTAKMPHCTVRLSQIESLPKLTFRIFTQEDSIMSANPEVKSWL